MSVNTAAALDASATPKVISAWAQNFAFTDFSWQMLNLCPIKIAMSVKNNCEISLRESKLYYNDARTFLEK